MRSTQILNAFDSLWTDLFSSPVHLDSALAKRPPTMKSALARMITPILLRPVSLAEALGVGVPSGEPWNLRGNPEALKNWRPARAMAERLYAQLQGGGAEVPSGSEMDYPPEMTAEWQAAFGEEVALSLARELSLDPPLGLRAARAHGAKALLEELKEGSRLPVSVKRSPISPVGVRLGGYAPVMGLGSYEKGKFEIQDEGSQFVSFFSLWPEVFGDFLVAAPAAWREGARVPDDLPEVSEKFKSSRFVDACAGAGGKSLAISDGLKGKGRVFAYDVSDKKLTALRRRARRAGLNNIQTVALPEGAEAGVLEKFHGTADMVLVDAPCTGWGVLRRNPDIKWRQSPESLQRMPEIQTRLLDLYSHLVAPGGRLVFSVCTFRLDETERQVQQFSEKFSEFRLGKHGFLGPGPTDGFYMAEWVRKG